MNALVIAGALSVALSPDGRQLAYGDRSTGERCLPLESPFLQEQLRSE